MITTKSAVGKNRVVKPEISPKWRAGSSRKVTVGLFIGGGITIRERLNLFRPLCTLYS